MTQTIDHNLQGVARRVERDFPGTRTEVRVADSGNQWLDIWYGGRLFVLVQDLARACYYIDEVEDGCGLGTWFRFRRSALADATRKLRELMRHTDG